MCCKNRTLSFVQKPCRAHDVHFEPGSIGSGLGWEKRPEEMEAEGARCNSRKTLCALLEGNGEFRGVSMDSIVPVKLLLTGTAQRLELKEKKFIVFTVAPQYELDALWTTILVIDKEFG